MFPIRPLAGIVLVVVASMAAFCAGSSDKDPSSASALDLARRARAILINRCYKCHGDPKHKIEGRKLKILDPQLVLKRKVVVPNKPDESDLISRVNDDDDPMPPKGTPRVPPEEREVLREWIKAGAVFVAEGEKTVATGAGAPQTSATANDALVELHDPHAPIARPLRITADDAPEAVPILPKSVGHPQPPPGSQLATAAKAQTLAARAYDILRTNCKECHCQPKPYKRIEILNYSALLKAGKIVPGKPDESLIYEVISGNQPSMPKGGTLDIAEVDAIRDWIAAGAPPFPTTPAPPAPERRPVIGGENAAGVEYVYEKILAHVLSVLSDERPSYRYFSFHHLLIEGASPRLLEEHRQALVIALNHLSLKPQLYQPVPIDPTHTIYAVDIRELGWDQHPLIYAATDKPAPLNFFDLVLLEYPYGVVYRGMPVFDDLVHDFLVPAHQVLPVPYVRADWFVSTATQPPLYHDLLELPLSLAELEKQLGVDEDNDLHDYVTKRGGLHRSRVSHNNRILERHPTHKGFGSFWRSFDYKTGVRAADIFKDPVVLHPDAGEFIFNLHNGLQGYFIADGQGRRLDAADTAIVTDHFAEDQTVRNGLSCIRCHDRGMKDFHDVVRPAFLALPGNSLTNPDQIGLLYPPADKMDGYLDADRTKFLSAMTAMFAGKLPEDEPLINVSKRFLEAPLFLDAASAELGWPPERVRALVQTPQLAILGLAPLGATPPGAVRRDAWEDYFSQTVSSLGLGFSIVPLDGLTRLDFDAQNPSIQAELETYPSAVHNGESVSIRVKNNGHNPFYIELIRTKVDGSKQILAYGGYRQFRVAPGKTYYFPPQEKGGFVVRDDPGKEQITLFASDEPLPPGQVLRASPNLKRDHGLVLDRVVHNFFVLDGEGKNLKVLHGADHLLKKTVTIDVVP